MPRRRNTVARGEIAKKALAQLEAGNAAKAWALVEPVRAHAIDDEELAWAVIGVSSEQPMWPEQRALLQRLAQVWLGRSTVAYAACDLVLATVDRRHGDDSLPEDDPAGWASEFLDHVIEQEGWSRTLSAETCGYVLQMAGNAHRACGPGHDRAAEAAYRAALAQQDKPEWRFNLGVLFKLRGRFPEGQALFAGLVEAGSTDAATLWNLAICATGAGDGACARQAWERLGFTASLGTDGLPSVDKLGTVKVRLSTGPLDQEIGARVYEHVWVAPRSPCHGEVLHATLHDGAELGDVVLWDGASIGEWQSGDRRGPRFASLGRLASGGARAFHFRATQSRPKEISELSRALPGGSGAYVFDEQVQAACAECLRTGRPHVAAHQVAHPARHPRVAAGALAPVVTGKLVVPGQVELREVQSTVRRWLREHPGVELAVPAFLEAIGDSAGARRHAALFEVLERRRRRG